MQGSSKILWGMLGIAACAASSPAIAFDPMLSNSATTRTNASVDPENSARPGEAFFARGVKAVRNNDYSFAINMYEVSASWGYKPAEYNLGVIYFKGEGGVAVDRPRGMAWFALAAERGDEDYVNARETAYAAMTAEEFAQANVVFRELKPRYGDDVALERAKQRWVQVRNEATGSHVGGATGPVLVGSRNMSNRNVVNDPSNPTSSIANSITNTAAGITGGGALDGSLVYRALRETDNPYDPKLYSGTVKVEPVVPYNGAAPTGDDVHPPLQYM